MLLSKDKVLNLSTSYCTNQSVFIVTSIENCQVSRVSNQMAGQFHRGIGFFFDQILPDLIQNVAYLCLLVFNISVCTIQIFYINNRQYVNEWGHFK